MKKNKSITVNINGNEVVLDEAEIKFYLSETKKKKVNKSKIEKFKGTPLVTFCLGLFDNTHCEVE